MRANTECQNALVVPGREARGRLFPFRPCTRTLVGLAGPEGEDPNHAFANPTGAHYDAADAKLAWKRTLAFFKANL